MAKSSICQALEAADEELYTAIQKLENQSNGGEISSAEEHNDPVQAKEKNLSTEDENMEEEEEEDLAAAFFREQAKKMEQANKLPVQGWAEVYRIFAPEKINLIHGSPISTVQNAQPISSTATLKSSGNKRTREPPPLQPKVDSANSGDKMETEKVSSDVTSFQDLSEDDLVRMLRREFEKQGIAIIQD